MSVKEQRGNPGGSTIRRTAPQAGEPGYSASPAIDLPPRPPGLTDEQWELRLRAMGYDPGVAKAEAARKRAAATAAKNKADHAGAVAQAQADIGYIWVNGHRMIVTGKNPDGSLMVQVDGVDKKPSAFGSDQTLAYGALDGGALPSSDTRFLMSVGPQMDEAGNVAKPTLVGNGAQPSMDGVTPTVMTQNPTGHNKFTVGLGVQWLAELSTKDPKTYDAMVEKLHDANYLNDADYAAAGGGWSSAVGTAFALLGRDTAVVNATAGGGDTSAEDLLNAKAKAGRDRLAAQKKKDYQPVERDYTDPTAITGQARTAAEAALGRRLTPAEEARLTSHFHGLEAGMYDQIDAAGRDGKNATVTRPNLAGQVDDFLYSGANAQEEANFRAGGYGDVIRKLVGL